MEFLVFANPMDVSKERFFQQISKMPAFSPTFIFEYGRFKSLLMRRPLNWKVIVFFAYNQDDLTMAQEIKAHMAGMRVIMVLHHIDAETVQQGLSISPCFTSYANSDFSDIIAVLEKIANLEK